MVAGALYLFSGVTSPREIATGILQALSCQTTTGFSVGASSAPAPVAVLLIALMAIGGQTGSTSGGIKVDRVRLLFAAIALTFQRLRSPATAVLNLRLDDKIVSPNSVLFAVALVVTYLTATCVLWIAFLLHGLPATESLFDIVSALSTVGASTGIVGPDLPHGLKLLTIYAMLLGRVEFFGLLVLVLPQTWKRRG